MMRSAFVAAFAVIAAAGASSASAQDSQGAQMPSHNIYCLAMPAGQDQPTAQLRCDIQKVSTKPPKPPKNCPLSWGDAFILNPTGVGQLLCHGDTTANPDDPVIAYGTQWRPMGFVCTSQTTGLTCVNGQGHGFTLARASQKVF